MSKSGPTVATDIRVVIVLGISSYGNCHISYKQYISYIIKCAHAEDDVVGCAYSSKTAHVESGVSERQLVVDIIYCCYCHHYHCPYRSYENGEYRRQ